MIVRLIGRVRLVATKMTSGHPQIKKRFLSTGRLGLKPAGRTSSFQKQNVFFSSPPPPPVHSSLGKMKLGGKKNPTSRLAVFFPTRQTRNDFLLKGGLSTQHLHTLQELQVLMLSQQQMSIGEKQNLANVQLQYKIAAKNTLR